MNRRRLIVPLLLAGLLVWGTPPPTWGKGGGDVTIEHNSHGNNSSLAPSISGSSRPVAPPVRQAEQRQSWRIVVRDMLRYLLGEAFPFLNGRLH